MRSPIKLMILTLSLFLGWAGRTGLDALLNGRSESASAPRSEDKGGQAMAQKIDKSDKEWKTELTPEQYKVMRQCGTEPPFSGRYDEFYEKGSYLCAACGTPLFSSSTKYDHGSGWPSFMAPISEKNIEYRDDYSLLMHRVEVRCAVCGAHLGHVFDDGPAKTHFCINSVALNFVPEGQHKSENAARAGGPSSKAAERAPKTETATFAAGCFWGIEYKFGQVKGVLSTAVGYSGGRTKNPTYKDVCSDKTGHAESVQVTFDPSQIGYAELVRKFFSFHDPTQLNRQGPDVGTQYRSVIFFASEEQKKIAEEARTEVEKTGIFKKRVVTEIVPAGEFFKAEEYHQKYYEKNKIKSCSF
jgi:peptide methionine sulfoxide reductase msrA/msrB